VRIGAAVVTIERGAQIGDDLLTGAASLELSPGSAVGGSLLSGGGQALISGTVTENLQYGGEGLELRGNVGGDVEAYVGDAGRPTWAGQTTFQGQQPPQVRSGLTIVDGTRIGGDLTYTSHDTFSLPADAVAGRVVHSERPADVTSAEPTPGSTLFDLLRRYAALLLVGLLLIWLAPRFSREITSELEHQPLASLGSGFISICVLALAFLAVPLATILLAVVLGTVKLTGLMGIVIAVGIVALLALIVLTIIAIAYVAQIAVSVELGRLILRRFAPTLAERPYAPLALGVALLVILTALPVVGWLFTLAAVLLGLGALWLLGRDTVQHRPIPAPIA
jgi:hypothetical protein